jgi:uncharacterized membrane protein
VKQSRRQVWLKVLTLVGCWSTGIIYSSIGVIAILSFLKLKQGGADESSFLALLDGFLAGRLLIWVIILGALCFIAWRFYEAFMDPYGVGNDKKGILLRTGAAFSSLADAFVALSALQAIYNHDKAPKTGEPFQQRALVADLLQKEWGQVLLIAVGVVVIITAVVLAIYGLSSRFTETIKADAFSRMQRRWVHGIAYAGYLSRAVVLGITGFFLFKAALKNNSRYVVNTDKAFDFIGDHIGHPYFLLVAAGTICYGLYMFILGLFYNVNGDRKGKAE